jgi:hypothetical protein
MDLVVRNIAELRRCTLKLRKPTFGYFKLFPTTIAAGRKRRDLRESLEAGDFSGEAVGQGGLVGR